MNLLTILAVLLAAAFAVLGTAKLLAIPATQTRAAHVGFSVDGYRRIGALEVAGAVGLLIGIAVPGLQAAASGGLLLLLIGAVIAHVRAGDDLRGATPALALAILVAGVAALAIGAL